MNDLTKWLEGLGLGEYANTFDENKIDYDVLTELTEEDLKDLGIPLGHRKKLMPSHWTSLPGLSPWCRSPGST